MSESDLSVWSASLTEGQMTCRDLHHAWFYATAARTPEGFERRLACSTCGTRKIQELDSNGYLVRTRYEYPGGYVRPDGAGRVTRSENADLRLQSLSSHLPKRGRRA